jgi:tRNA dimethylallyltransferase
MNNQIIVIVGPTASGKTNLSISLANELNTEIINADSRQVYKFMDIGTAKPTKEERNKVPHYFIDHVAPDEHYDAGLFGKEGRFVFSELIKNNKTPIVSGGSGLYIKSLIDGLFEGPEQDGAIRHKLEARIQTEGINSLLDELKKVDPESAHKLLPTNKHRIIRALEVYYLTGKSITELQKENKIDIDFSPFFFGLEWDRKTLYNRIDKRVIQMIDSGLIEEVKKLLEIGYSKDLKSFRTVGYKEPIEYLEGKISFEEMIRQIQQFSRNYAKRQLTWFRADKRIEWLEASLPQDELLKKIYNRISKSGFPV